MVHVGAAGSYRVQHMLSEGMAKKGSYVGGELSNAMICVFDETESLVMAMANGSLHGAWPK